ncbi:DEAD box family helicase [Coprinopsis cinerea okayama7|uniref:DEAD box family helicase n=1 Tax=Coprinopsis cinerea (strain Okayama-7 / 130 / ATCC MYA-4618 / FGSC 9003) TaxID=240176 RepID=A8N1C9_COPC7|nr:DEAD box family helicase [Coprinopsis cinerea okayama7\|eukprot:XP_001828678.2 DEAD box family helicase [Coprinopsis cinerea okayama7\
MLYLRCSKLPLAPRARLASTAITLRPYQEHCLSSCLEALGSGVSRIGVSLPTGSGKTTVFITLLSRLRATNDDATRALIIVNSIELARQSAATAKLLFPGWSVEIEQGAKHIASGLADLTVATYQTLLNPSRFEKYNPRLFKAVVVDEAHHAAAPSYRRLLSRFHHEIHPPKGDEHRPHNHSVPIIGVSATFNRHDQLALSAVFEKIVYHRDFVEMIDEEWLCGVRLTSVRVKLDLDTVDTNPGAGDFKSKSLAKVMNTPDMNEIVVKVWLDRAQKRKSTLVFCVDLRHVQELTDTFRRFGIDARNIHSHTPAVERRELVTAFRAGEFPVLINCAVLTEGADIPNIDCVLLARPTKSRNVFMQMIGRGMRLSPATGKQDCLIIDFVDSAGRVDSVLSLPSLLGLNPLDMDPDKHEMDLSELKALAALKADRTPQLQPDIREMGEVTNATPAATSVSFVEHDDIAKVFDSVKLDDYRAISPYAWVKCQPDVYILECVGKGTVRVSRANDKYIGEFVSRDKAIKYRMLSAEDLPSALRAADQYIQRKLYGYTEMANLLRSAAWRKYPASKSQIDLISSRLEKTIASGKDAPFKAMIAASLSGLRRSEPVTLESLKALTKGEASIILCKLIHGNLVSP